MSTRTASFWFRLLTSAMLLCMLISAQGGVLTVSAGTDVWSTNGPGGGGIIVLTIDPVTPAVLYAGTWGSGIYKSTDAGGHWHDINTGLQNLFINALAIDPQTGTILYAGTENGFFKSMDGGESWNESNTGLYSEQVQAVAVDPQTPSTLYVGTPAGLFKSVDSGREWRAVYTDLHITHVWVFAIDPTNPATIYAGMGFGTILKSTNQGESWNVIMSVDSGVDYVHVTSLVIDPVTPGTLYAGNSLGSVMKITDGGQNWTYVKTGLPPGSIRSLAIDPVTPSILYTGTASGVYKTSNGGEYWFPINHGLDDTYQISALVLDPSTPATLYAGTWLDGGLFKSVNRGENWTLANLGMSNTRVLALAIDPMSPNNLYAGAYGGAYKSNDGGGSWFPVNTGLTQKDVISLAIDPLTPSTLYAGAYGGLFKSTDGGGNWFAVNDGLTGSDSFPVVALAIDPSIPSTLYAGILSVGLYKSTDSGLHWNPINDGLTIGWEISLVIDPVSPATLYAGTTKHGIFKSINGGGNWSPIDDGLTDMDITALTIDPTTSTLFSGTLNGHIFKSMDGGASWFLFSNGLPSSIISDLAIDPLTPSNLYAATNEGVYRSINGGQDWSAFNSGLANTRVNAMAIDPVTPMRVYAGTDGNGVAKYSSSAVACQAAAGQVVINEILPSPSKNSADWVELYNTSDHPVDIGYCFLDNTLDTINPPRQIGAATILPAHGFWTMDQVSNFNNKGDEVRLLKEDAMTVLDSHSFAGTGYDRSHYRLPDGGAWAATTTSFPTKGQTNTLSFYPIVSSSLRSGLNPTDAGSVTFTVNFSKAVTGVNISAPFSDFSLTTFGVSGAYVSAVGGSGSIYTVTVNTGNADGTIRLNVQDDDTIRDSGNKPLGGMGTGNGNFTSGEVYTIDKAFSFEDVSATHPYWQEIELLFANGLTGGCQANPLKFCPDQMMNRGEAAAFMLRGNFGPGYTPPLPTHLFKDNWNRGPWAEGWAEGMYSEGFSAGCLASPLKYCPWDSIPREQAMIFALKLKYGNFYTPPPATGALFADMTDPSYYATAWAEQAYQEELIPDCGMSGGKPKICPKAMVSRGLAAYMIVRARGLTQP